MKENKDVVSTQHLCSSSTFNYPGKVDYPHFHGPLKRGLNFVKVSIDAPQKMIRGISQSRAGKSSLCKELQENESSIRPLHCIARKFIELHTFEHETLLI